MGLAVDGPAGHRHAQGVWFLRNAPDIAPRIEPAGMHDACYLAALVARHRRHRHSRDGLGRRGAVDRQHALLVSGDAESRLQLRAALAAAVHLGSGRRRPLPSQRAGHRGGRAAICHRAGHDRRARRLASRQAARRLHHRRALRRVRQPRPVDAAFAALARRPAAGARIRDRAALCSSIRPPAGGKTVAEACPASPAAWRFADRMPLSACRRFAKRPRWTACRWPSSGSS